VVLKSQNPKDRTAGPVFCSPGPVQFVVFFAVLQPDFKALTSAQFFGYFTCPSNPQINLCHYYYVSKWGITLKQFYQTECPLNQCYGAIRRPETCNWQVYKHCPRLQSRTGLGIQVVSLLAAVHHSRQLKRGPIPVYVWTLLRNAWQLQALLKREHQESWQCPTTHRKCLVKQSGQHQ